MLPASTLAGTPRPPLGCNCRRQPCTQRAPRHPERLTDPLDAATRHGARGCCSSSRTCTTARRSASTGRLQRPLRKPLAFARRSTMPTARLAAAAAPFADRAIPAGLQHITYKAGLPQAKAGLPKPPLRSHVVVWQGACTPQRPQSGGQKRRHHRALRGHTRSAAPGASRSRPPPIQLQDGEAAVSRLCAGCRLLLCMPRSSCLSALEEQLDRTHSCYVVELLLSGAAPSKGRRARPGVGGLRLEPQPTRSADRMPKTRMHRSLVARSCRTRDAITPTAFYDWSVSWLSPTGLTKEEPM